MTRTRLALTIAGAYSITFTILTAVAVWGLYL